MEPDDENIRQSDVTLWGAIALVCGALAVVSVNFGAMLPANLMTGLHSTRLEGGNLNSLRAQVAQILDESARIRNENLRLQSTLTRTEKGQGDVVRRVGAIENTLPGLLDLSGDNSGIDSSIITAAIADDESAQTMDTEGGSVKVTQRPMLETKSVEQTAMPPEPGRPQTMLSTAPIPQQRQPDVLSTQADVAQSGDMATAFGVALGDGVTLREAVLVWKDITQKAGPLLLGLEPLISGNESDPSLRLIAGPIDSYTQAEKICGRMVRVGILCLPVSYAGKPLIE